MSRFKKLFVILAAVISADCAAASRSDRIIDKAYARCDPYTKGSEWAAGRKLIKLGLGRTATLSQLANDNYPTDEEIKILLPFLDGLITCRSEAFEIIGRYPKVMQRPDVQQSIKLNGERAILSAKLIKKEITWGEYFQEKMNGAQAARDTARAQNAARSAARNAAAAATSARKQQAMQEYWKRARESVSSWDTDLGTIDTQPYKPAQRQNQSNVVNCKRAGDMSNQVYTYQNSCPIGYFRVN
jgi:hypothetical protein